MTLDLLQDPSFHLCHLKDIAFAVLSLFYLLAPPLYTNQQESNKTNAQLFANGSN
jgi:hypothetical protein